MVMLLFHFTSLLGCSYSALAKPVLDNIESLSPSALTSTTEVNAFPEYPLTDGATPNFNTGISWVDPSSPNLLSEKVSNPAVTNSFTISAETPCGSRTRTNGKLRIRDPPGFCAAGDAPMTQPKVPSTQPLQHADYGSDYEQARPAVSPEEQLSRKRTERRP